MVDEEEVERVDVMVGGEMLGAVEGVGRRKARAETTGTGGDGCKGVTFFLD